MSITIKDVAKEANVSPSTVSRVVAGSPKISEETKIKVNAVIKKLNYHPNVIARSLVNRSTQVVGIILPSAAEELFRNPFFIQIMAGISAYVQKYGYYIMCTFCKTEEEEVAAVRNYVTSNLVEGIILTVVRHNDQCISCLQELDFPFVAIGRPEENKNILWVDNDNVQAMYNVVSKLLMEGYREIAFIGAGSELNVSKDRLSGYKQAHNDHEVAFDEKRIVEVKQFKEELGCKAMVDILSRSQVEAVVAADDLLAFGANICLTQMNRQDIAITGFNNTLLAQYQNPPLTSVEINAEKIGFYAAKLLVDKLENKIEETFFIVETHLIERKSTEKYYPK